MVPKIGPQVNSMMDHQDHTWTLNIKASKTFWITVCFSCDYTAKLSKIDWDLAELGNMVR